jgi:hypothetical protein
MICKDVGDRAQFHPEHPSPKVSAPISPEKSAQGLELCDHNCFHMGIAIARPRQPKADRHTTHAHKHQPPHHHTQVQQAEGGAKDRRVRPGRSMGNGFLVGQPERSQRPPTLEGARSNVQIGT